MKTRIPFAAALAVAATAASAQPSPFLAENAKVMTRMHAAMEIAPTGDVDRDFVAMMIPHHQGAIEMARLQLRYGRDERLRRLAQEIIVTQQHEIVAMRLALADGAPSRSQATSDTPRQAGHVEER